MTSPADQTPPSPPPSRRRRRTDEERLADLQAKLETLVTKSQAPKPKVKPPVRRKQPARRAPVKKPTSGKATPIDAALDAELRGLVESFVVALREVVRKELVAQARRTLAAPDRD